MKVNLDKKIMNRIISAATGIISMLFFILWGNLYASDVIMIEKDCVSLIFFIVLTVVFSYGAAFNVTYYVLKEILVCCYGGADIRYKLTKKDYISRVCLATILIAFFVAVLWDREDLSELVIIIPLLLIVTPSVSQKRITLYSKYIFFGNRMINLNQIKKYRIAPPYFKKSKAQRIEIYLENKPRIEFQYPSENIEKLDQYFTKHGVSKVD